MSLRLLHVLDHSLPLHSGYSFRTFAIVQQQRARGWETFHVTGPRQGRVSAARETASGLEFHRTPVPGRALPLPFGELMAVVRSLERRLREVIDEVRPDIVHVHSPALNGLAALRAARRAGLPLVYEVRAFWEDAAVDHGTTREGSLRYRLSRGVESYVLHRVDAVTCICEGLRDEITQRGVPADRVTVIPNAVDAERFTFQPPRDETLTTSLGLDGALVLGFIGSFYAYEGLDLAIDALVQLRDVGHDVHLLLVGGGPQSDALRERARRRGVADRVHFTGRIAHEDVARYYGLVDILLYPRRAMRLTDLVTPLKPLEAMAHGRPLVASDVGGHRELIRDGQNGVLFRAGDAAALAEVVAGLLSDPERRGILVRGGRDYVDTERTWERSVAGYEPIYQRLAGDRWPRAATG